MELTTTKEEELKQYIVVCIGSEQYGIDISYIDNIVRMQKMTRVPKAQKQFKGIINLRGDIVPVMSLRTRMKLPEDELTGLSRIIILRIDDRGLLGVMVDEVKEVVKLGTNEVKHYVSKKNKIGENFISDVGQHEEQLISILNMKAIVDEKHSEKYGD